MLTDLRYDNSLFLYRVRTTVPVYGPCDEVAGSKRFVSEPLTLREAIRMIRQWESDEVYVDLIFLPTGEVAERVEGAPGDGSMDDAYDDLPF